MSKRQYVYQVALVVKNLPANAGDGKDAGLIPGPGRSPGGGHGNPLQDSCLQNPMDRAAWWATVHGFEMSQTHLKSLSTGIWRWEGGSGGGTRAPVAGSCECVAKTTTL